MKRNRVLKITLPVLIGLIVCTVAWVFIGRHGAPAGPSDSVTPVADPATASMQRLHQVATKDGVRQWRLDAASARYRQAQNQATLTDLAVTFYSKDNGKVELKADRGTLQTDSKDIEVSGNVEAVNGGYRLVTRALEYAHRRGELSTQTPVTLTGPNITLRADTLVFDLKGNRAVFEGNVKGVFSDKIRL